MIDAVTTKPTAFDVILVHSFSRFFRDQFQLEFYVRRLAKNGVRLVSITQELGDDPMSNMIRQIMALFSEYQSKENAKHTLRAMKENARQGFWGSKSVLLRTHVAASSGNRQVLECPVLYRSGAPDTIRTCDLCLRRATLYPAELRVLVEFHLADWRGAGNRFSPHRARPIFAGQRPEPVRARGRGRRIRRAAVRR